MTQKEKFLKQLEEDRNNGLIDTNFFIGNTCNITEEEVYAELNRMEEADDVDVEMI